MANEKQVYEKKKREQKLKQRDRVIQLRKEIAELSGVDRLTYDLGVLESQIKSVRNDLLTTFKGNAIIQNKYNLLLQRNKNILLEIEKIKKAEIKHEVTSDAITKMC